MDEKLKEALEIIHALTDDNPCELDRYGHCQMHSRFRQDICPNYRGLELLAEYQPEEWRGR